MHNGIAVCAQPDLDACGAIAWRRTAQQRRSGGLCEEDSAAQVVSMEVRVCHMADAPAPCPSHRERPFDVERRIDDET